MSSSTTPARVPNPPDSVQRHSLLKRELERYLPLLIDHYDPEQIIVFGSLATGEVHAWSDIDLIVVRRTHQPFWRRLRETRRLLKPRVGTDILVYTPEEFEQMLQERPVFREELVAKGTVLYERER